jgi:redox-sensitive bicupin YhaK (pirin superfamily)
MGQKVLQLFPLGFPWQTQDPFLFCVYHLDHYPKGNGNMGPEQALLNGRNLGNDFITKDGWRMYHGTSIPGFPSHPHCGFETITMVNKGYCDHSDSLGAAGRFGQGDVQWMTAGRGVQHSEMFPLLNDDKENTLELFQIWLNLPKSSKYADPHFKMLWHEDIPVIEEDQASVKVVAGKYQGKDPMPPAPDSWAADEENEVAIWHIQIEPHGSLTLPKASTSANRTLYFYEGENVVIEENKIMPNHGIALDANQEVILKNGNKKGYFLMLQGKPINEPVAKYGPFVMNTQEEIQQVMDQFRLTQFGGWPWPYPDHVHNKDQGRFAKYPNGEIIEKS